MSRGIGCRAVGLAVPLLAAWQLARAQNMAGMSRARSAEAASAASAPSASGGPSNAPAATLTVVRDHGDVVLDVGPIDLPAHAMHDMVRQPPVLARALGVDGWMHGYSIDIVDSAGNPVPHEILHHFVVTDPQRRDLFTPLMLRIAAASAETAPVDLTRFVGFRIEPTDSIIVSAMVHNPTDRAYYGVHIRLRMPFTNASAWKPTLSVFPLYIDVMPPTGGHSFDVPPGRSEYHWDGSPAVSGRILGLSGHLHKYGVLLQLEDRTEHKVLWSVTPDTDAAGDIKDIPISKFIRTFGIPVQPDHVYRLTAVYDNPTGATIVDGGMGAVGGVIHPTGPWPSIDRSNAVYQFDWKYTWRDTIAPNDEPMRAMHGMRSMPPAP